MPGYRVGSAHSALRIKPYSFDRFDNRMRHSILLLVLMAAAIANVATVVGQQQKPRDPCEEPPFMPLLNEAPTITATDVRSLPKCFSGKFIRLVGVYRVAFENSELYDPTGEEGRTWITFDPFYSAVKRCSAPGTLQALDRKSGGTFGFVAMGIFHGPELPKSVDPKLPPALRESLEKHPPGYGHMNRWPNEFQVICIEKVVLFSGDGSVLQYQKPDVRKRILEWYAKDHSP